MDHACVAPLKLQFASADQRSALLFLSDFETYGKIMALDMHAGGLHECIGHHEEFLFQLAQADESRYPELLAVWEKFYDGPRISARQAGLLVHELIELVSLNGGLSNRPLANLVVRLLPFFSGAHRSQNEIRCISD